MNRQKLATAAALLVLPVSTAAVPGSAAAHSPAKHRNTHQLARPGHQKAHRSGRAGHKSHTVSFTARVVRSSASGLSVRTADGRVLSFSKKQIKPGRVSQARKHRKGRGSRVMHAADLQLSAGNVVVNLLGLQPGVVVEITETVDADGTVTITITLPPPSGQQQASGVLTEVDTDAFNLQSSAAGGELRMHMSSDALASLGLQACSIVDVSYHQDAGILIADNVTTTGTSTGGDCAPTYDASGSIAQVSAAGLTVNTDQGPLSFGVDPSSGVTDGYQPNDLVDVTYVKNADGTLRATDIQFVEGSASGQVTSVTTSASGGSVTITDGNGRPETFIADPANGVQINAHAFNGVAVGDQIDVSYHQAAGQLVADTVSEQ